MGLCSTNNRTHYNKVEYKCDKGSDYAQQNFRHDISPW